MRFNLLCTCCKFCGTSALEKRQGLYGLAAKALLSVAVRIVLWIILSGV